MKVKKTLLCMDGYYGNLIRVPEQDKTQQPPPSTEHVGAGWMIRQDGQLPKIMTYVFRNLLFLWDPLRSERIVARPRKPTILMLKQYLVVYHEAMSYNTRLLEYHVLSVCDVRFP